MAKIAYWILPAVLFCFFLLGAWVNLSILLQEPDKNGRKPSMVPVFPGLAGAFAISWAPLEVLHPWFWVPLLLDVGCVPFLVLIGIAMLGKTENK